MNFNDIPKKTRDGRYRISVDWDFLEEAIARYQREYSLEINPDFQRGHVWDDAKQIAYVEHVLQGGQASNELRFNCVGWMNKYEGPMVLVDGLQRLTAVLRFLKDEIKAFGHTCSELRVPGIRQKAPTDMCFYVYINDLPTRKEVLQWYLDLNTGGVIHTEEEIEKVKKLLFFANTQESK